MKKIFVTGSLAFDRIMNFDGKFSDHILPEKIHDLNISLVVNDVKENFGGCAGNIAYNLALLGEKPVILSSAGKDFGPYKTWLEKFGVDNSRIVIDQTRLTSSVNIVTDQANNQFSTFHSGAGAQLCSNIQSDDLDKDSIAIIAPTNVDDMVTHAALYKENDVPYIFDPGQRITAHSRESLLQCIDGAHTLICNDYELSMVLKKIDLKKTDVQRMVQLLITTYGERGSIIEQGKEMYNIPPARPLNTSDPTGAGDAFRAGFIKGLVSGLSLEMCGKLGAVVAVYTVEKYGTQTHHFTIQELKQRYTENFGEELTI